ncbi:MAG: DUF2079 domain-containing protein [Acidimicrobiia bacterium]|nr:DUF2079 domain-containing protein [Acidimicrobiia bacterium]
MSELPLQRRLRRAIVRFQARLEAGPGDRWIPTLIGVGLSGFLAWTAVSRIDGLEAGVDLAGYSQTLWLLTQGNVPRASLFGTDVHLLELRWSFVLYALALPATVFPPAKLLVVTQSIALGLAVLPLWRLARQRAKLRIGAASALCVAYALHPATHRIGTEDFHPVSLAVPAIIAAAYFGATKRWFWYWACIVFALLCRADLGLALGFWGFVLLGDGERRAGLWTMGVGFVWALTLLLVAQPLIAQPGFPDARNGYNGQTLGDVTLASLRDPVGALQILLTQDNLLLVIGLLTPVIFLPLLSLRHLLPAAPLAGLLLLSGPTESPFPERGAMLLAFVMIAAAYALNRLGNMGVDRVFLDIRLLTTLAAAAVLLFVASSPTSPYARPWDWPERDATDRAAVRAAELLDPELPVRASPSALTVLSDRPWLYSLAQDRQPSAANMAFPDFTRAVLVLEREIPERTEEEREQFDNNMALVGFEILLDDRNNGVTLYVRQ